MALQQIQVDGNAAREVVLQHWPAATSSYTGARTAEVYDPVTGAVLGKAEADEFVVEHAWVDAAQPMLELNSPIRRIVYGAPINREQS